MQVTYYTRSPQGLIKGPYVEEWGSEPQMLENCYRDDETPEPGELKGWPHSAVVWYGDVGIAQMHKP